MLHLLGSSIFGSVSSIGGIGILIGSSQLIRRLCLLIGSTSVLLLMTHQYMKPRLPLYTIQINHHHSPYLSWLPLKLPKGILVRKSPVTKQWQVKLSTNIQFYNENYMQVSIHAMTFDAYIELKPFHLHHYNPLRYFYNDTDTSTGTVGRQKNRTLQPPPQRQQPPQLFHIATITDQNQHCVAKHDTDSDDDATTTGTCSSVLWSIPGRTNFSIQNTPLYISPFHSQPPTTNTATTNATVTTSTNTLPTMTCLQSVLYFLYRLISSNIQQYRSHNSNIGNNSDVAAGVVTFSIPTTGVAHIRVIPTTTTTTATATGSRHNNYNNGTSSNSSTSSSHTSALSSRGVGGGGGLPFTVGMICDNTIHLFTLQIIGIQCQQYMIVPGWKWNGKNQPKPSPPLSPTQPKQSDISNAATALRQYALTQLTIRNSTTGSVFG